MTDEIERSNTVVIAGDSFACQARRSWPHLRAAAGCALRLNPHHGGAEGGGRDEAVCLGRRPRIRRDDGGVADSLCRRPQRNDGGVTDSPCRPAARSVARCNTSRVRSPAQLPRQLR